MTREYHTDPVVAEAMGTAQQRAATLVEVEVDAGEAPPLIAPGEYEAVGLEYEHVRLRRFGPEAAKLVVRWQVLVPDAEAEFGRRIVILPRFYNVAFNEKTRRYRAPATGELAREWTRVSGRRTRRERMTAKVFIGVLCRVMVETVERDGKNHALGAASYSVVRRVVERLAGGSPQ